MTETEFFPTSSTIDYDIATNELVLRFSTFNVETKDMDTLVVRLPDLKGIDFAGSVAKHGAYLAEQCIAHALVGDCPRCQNTRLVDVPRPHRAGGTESVRCPDCGDRYDNMPPVPSVRAAGPRPAKNYDERTYENDRA